MSKRQTFYCYSVCRANGVSILRTNHYYVARAMADIYNLELRQNRSQSKIKALRVLTGKELPYKVLRKITNQIQLNFN